MVLTLNTVVEAAKKAGAVLKKNFGDRAAAKVIGRGNSGDITRVADKLAEDIIIAEVRRIGDAEIVSEEVGTLHFGAPRYRWVVDPLDGSTNFARSIPLFAISILVEEYDTHKPLFGVVYEPMAGRCFSAENGKGAMMDGQPIQTNKRRRLEDCIFYLDMHFAGEPAKYQKFEKHIRRLGQTVKTFRSLGSCAIALAYTGLGTLDGFLDLSRNSRFVDVAGGLLVLREAGGHAMDLNGRSPGEDYIGLLACSSKQIAEQVRALVKL